MGDEARRKAYSTQMIDPRWKGYSVYTIIISKDTRNLLRQYVYFFCAWARSKLLCL